MVDRGITAPVGVVGLLFTDIEGSTRLAMELGPRWSQVLSEHHALVSGAIAAEGGYVDGTEGDAFFATFSDGRAGVRAAIAALAALRRHRWPSEVGELRVRMGLHVGWVQRAATGYVGLEVHRAARVASAAHGGQLLLTGPGRAAAAGIVSTEPLGLHRLKDFPAPEELFCAVVDERGAAAFPPPRTPAFRPNNLPARSQLLVGRDRDLARVRRSLAGDQDRLVTLMGRGGIGKTSLAVALGHELLDDRPGGVWFTSLAAVRSPDQALQQLANEIDAPSKPGASPEEAIVARLRGRGPTLVIMDNLEHVLAVAPQLAALLRALPELSVLCTSQAPIGLTIERRLTLDTIDDEAALSLVEREAARQGVDPARLRDDRAALLDVVHLLDGLPLALELAAARLSLLSPGQLRDRLGVSTAVLKHVVADRPKRQHSLRATVDWSLGLLEDEPRGLFSRLGVFAGPVELKEIEAITGVDGLDVLEALSALLDVSLVRRVERGDGRIQLGLPEALRQIAAELLDASEDGDEWRRAHAGRQLQIAWAARATGDAAWADYEAAVAADVEASAALSWARAVGDPVAAPLGAARAALLVDLGRVPEALRILEPLLQEPSGDPIADAQAHHSHAYALTVCGRADDALAEVNAALSAAPDPVTTAKALMLRGLIHLDRGEPELALRDSEAAAAVAHEVGPALYSGILVMEAQARMACGDLDGAADHIAEAERVGAGVDTTRLRDRYAFQCELARLHGRPEEALAYALRAIGAWEERGSMLHLLGNLASAAGLLAELRYDPEAVEMLGIIEAVAADVHGPGADPYASLDEPGTVLAAEHRLGPAAAEHRKKGLSVAAGMRATRGTQLIRIAQPSDHVSRRARVPHIARSPDGPTRTRGHRRWARLRLGRG